VLGQSTLTSPGFDEIFLLDRGARTKHTYCSRVWRDLLAGQRCWNKAWQVPWV